MGDGAVREIRGGVAGWLSERAAAVSVAEPSAPAPARPVAAGTVPARAGSRSPSTLRRLLGQAERELAAATARRDDLGGRLAGAEHTEMARLSTELAAADAEVMAAEERWLVLADEAEGQGLSW